MPSTLDEKLLAFDAEESWTKREAFEGTIIFGGTGSGKTSGSGAKLANAFLTAGYGGLVLTAKREECELWKEYLRAAARRAEDLIVVSPTNPNNLNFLVYESARSSTTSMTNDLVQLLLSAMSGGRDRKSSKDPFWDESIAQLLTNAIDLCTIVNRTVSISDIVSVIRSAPAGQEQAWEILYKEYGEKRREELGRNWADDSECAKLLIKGSALLSRGELRSDAARNLRETFKFWTADFALLDKELRSNIAYMLMTRLSGLLRDPYFTLFGTNLSVTPDDTFEGKVILLDLPVKEFGEVGRFAQILFKTIWQRAAERRSATGKNVFLWADEAQYFATKHDMLFQQTARSSRVATVYLTQSLANLRAMMDGGESGGDADGLVGTLQTKVFHANGCPVTNGYAEELFGQTKGYLKGFGAADEEPDNYTRSAQEAYMPNVPSTTFTRLAKGGESNHNMVEAYVFHAGKAWKSGANFYAWEILQPFRKP